jgi:hypothetical protein
VQKVAVSRFARTKLDLASCNLAVESHLAPPKSLHPANSATCTSDGSPLSGLLPIDCLEARRTKIAPSQLGGGLNLVIAAITLWNTVYSERAAVAQREHGSADESLLRHVAPLSWNHIRVTGDYTNKRVAKGDYRPLRRPKPAESMLPAP